MRFIPVAELPTFNCGDLVVGNQIKNRTNRYGDIPGCGILVHSPYHLTEEALPLDTEKPGPWNDYANWGSEEAEVIHNLEVEAYAGLEIAGRAEAQMKLCNDCYPLSARNVFHRDSELGRRIKQIWGFAEQLEPIVPTPTVMDIVKDALD